MLEFGLAKAEAIAEALVIGYGFVVPVSDLYLPQSRLGGLL